MGPVRVLAPLVRGTTYRRAVHLLLGSVILLPYLLLAAAFVQMLGNPRASQGAALLALGASLVIGSVPAFLSGTRSLEIFAARFLLDADVPEPEPGTRPDGETRMRAALWFGMHLAVGGVIGALLLIALPMALIFVAQRFGIADDQLAGLRLGRLDENDTWWWTAIGVALLVGVVYVIAALGALAAVMAPVLLGPSQAERLAALEARSRRLAERNRLARDLHDSIGHALTVTTLQAGAAREVFDSDPAFARRALEAIEETGRLAMDDLDHVLGMLRDDPASAQPLRTLDDLDRLCADSAAGGADVDCELIGPVARVPAVMSREGYRIVQEGLTNAARHAGRVPVRLVVTVTDEALGIAISNPVTAVDTARRNGSGLRGMRERVELLGGEITAGAADGVWRVAVRLPIGGRP